MKNVVAGARRVVELEDYYIAVTTLDDGDVTVAFFKGFGDRDPLTLAGGGKGIVRSDLYRGRKVATWSREQEKEDDNPTAARFLSEHASGPVIPVARVREVLGGLVSQWRRIADGMYGSHNYDDAQVERAAARDDCADDLAGYLLTLGIPLDATERGEGDDGSD